jgi:hypothetical protein
MAGTQAKCVRPGYEKKHDIMDRNLNSFDSYVEKSILANNEYGIESISGLHSIKSIYFNKNEYPKIEALIMNGQIESLKDFRENQLQEDDYLDVMLFSNQRNEKFIVTVYDSNALEQDPQVIQIYKL